MNKPKTTTVAIRQDLIDRYERVLQKGLPVGVRRSRSGHASTLIRKFVKLAEANPDTNFFDDNDE